MNDAMVKVAAHPEGSNNQNLPGCRFALARTTQVIHGVTESPGKLGEAGHLGSGCVWLPDVLESVEIIALPIQNILKVELVLAQRERGCCRAGFLPTTAK